MRIWLAMLSMALTAAAQHRVTPAGEVPAEAVALAERVWNTLLTDCDGHTYRGQKEVRDAALTIVGSAATGGAIEWNGESTLTGSGVRESIAIVKSGGGWQYELPEGTALRRSPCPNPAQATTAPVYTVRPGISPPQLLKRVEPDYSEEARKAKFQGTVLMKLVVDEKGNTRDISVLRSPGMGLDEQAIKAVKKWKFKPAEKDGATVAVQVQVEVSFRLQ